MESRILKPIHFNEFRRLHPGKPCAQERRAKLSVLPKSAAVQNKLPHPGRWGGCKADRDWDFSNPQVKKWA